MPHIERFRPRPADRNAGRDPAFSVTHERDQLLGFASRFALSQSSVRAEVDHVREAGKCRSRSSGSDAAWAGEPALSGLS